MLDATGERGTQSVRLDSLTGMRWWAAFGVFAYHMTNLAPLPSQDLLRFGYSGVSFFFILSGFVLTWSARPEVTARQFWCRRVARIWPAHLVALALALPVFYTLGTPDPAQSWVKPLGPVVLWSVPLLQGFSTDDVISFSGNPAAWTLSCEVFFYLLHPFINARRGSKRVAVLLLGASLLSGLWFCLVPHAGVPSPVARSWEFLLGMGLAHLARAGLRTPVTPWLAYPVLLLAPIYYYITVTRDVGPSALVPLGLAVIYGAAIWIGAQQDLTGTASGMRQRLLVRAGEVSFCFYLVHATVLYEVKARTGVVSWGRPVLSLVVWAGVFLGALAVSWVLHRLVERPCEKRLRAWGDRRWGRATAMLA
ncbi:MULTISPECIES: acyltransferase [unclassified Actinomyces]|uniref:acyltransferase family protein n=1 Tax=unclassified Actinomyces TaxID=2609248 RepID=UPI00201826E3|nr:MULTISPECIES: acyltransferase [unclassified Actinomyces]MCL3776977.1 acyltransferase [Actinomyces sp. AC-20-1]MCL3789032.1 acyltransferase [Actinomyces sp. 187325]MCL3791453.1 acyltransferase [Actinomyces sp. 186855]MCL3794016.1 acyltransferase [Actinomyces sp. 217892]